MKRILSVVVSGMVLAGFLACTKKEEPKPAQAVQPPAATQAQEQALPSGGEPQPGS